MHPLGIEDRWESSKQFSCEKSEANKNIWKTCGQTNTKVENKYVRVDKPNFDRPNFDKPNFDRPNFDKPNFDKPNFDRPNFDKPNFERPKVDRPKITCPKFRFGQLVV